MSSDCTWFLQPNINPLNLETYWIALTVEHSNISGRLLIHAGNNTSGDPIYVLNKDRSG